jgi:hypothetical protein
MRAAGDPTLTVKRETAGWHYAMNMRMKRQGLAPGVEHGEESEASAETGGVGGDSKKGAADRAEQQIVNYPRVL